MTRFCTDTIQAGPHLRPTNGVLRAPALAVTGEARHAAELLLRRAHVDADAARAAARAEADTLLAAAADEAQAMREAAEADAAQMREEAEDEAAQVREEAETEAHEVREAAHAEAQDMTAAEQQRVLEQAGALLGGLEHASAAIVERVDEIAIELAQKLFDRLVSELTPRERLAAALKHVVLEAPPKLVDSLLRVHPDEVDLLPEVDWPIKADPSIARGACRLEASSGQWCASFDAAMDALNAAFRQGVDEARPAAGEAEEEAEEAYADEQGEDDEEYAESEGEYDDEDEYEDEGEGEYDDEGEGEYGEDEGQTEDGH